jgi:hypothetical protein
VNRWRHAKHSRRRRIDAPAFAERESMTLSSRLPHFGHRMIDERSIYRPQDIVGAPQKNTSRSF